MHICIHKKGMKICADYRNEIELTERSSITSIKNDLIKPIIKNKMIYT